MGLLLLLLLRLDGLGLRRGVLRLHPSVFPAGCRLWLLRRRRGGSGILLLVVRVVLAPEEQEEEEEVDC